MTIDAAAPHMLKDLAEDLRARREHIKQGGGPEKIAAQHAKEKLTARERLEQLIDSGTFVELGMHGRPHFSQRAMEGREAPADGVITGYGKVNGRLAAVECIARDVSPILRPLIERPSASSSLTHSRCTA